MNKGDMNRKIQILENQVKELEKANYNLVHYCKCKACSDIRKARHDKFMETYQSWKNVLNNIENKYF